MWLYAKLVSIILLFVAKINIYAFEQSLSPQENITVGDKVVLNLKAEGLTVDTVDKSALQKLNFGDFELIDLQPAQDDSLNVVLSVYKSGKVELLSVEIPYNYNDQK